MALPRKRKRVVNEGAPPAPRPDRRRAIGTWFAGVAAALLTTLIAAWLTPLPTWIKSQLSPSSPITVRIQREGTSCTPYVIPKKIDDIGPPPPYSEIDPDAWPRWAWSKDAADGEWTKVLVTVQGTGNAQVTVTGLDITVLRRSRALSGSYVSRRCGSQTVARFAVVDLDKSPPKITESSRVERMWGDQEWRTTPLRFPYVVSNSDTENLLLIAKTSQYVEWKAAILWSTGKNSGKEDVSWDGKAFKTSASTNATWYGDAGGSWQAYG